VTLPGRGVGPGAWLQLATAVLLVIGGFLISGNSKPASAAPAFSYWFPWYDNASPGMSVDNIHVVNPTGGIAVVTISLAGSPDLGGGVPAFGERYWNWPVGTTIGGPVQVTSNQPLVVTQRVTYGYSFNEISALPADSAGVSFWFPWFDKASPGILNDNIHLVNPGSVVANVTATLGQGGFVYGIPVPAHGANYHAFPTGIAGGPVHIQSDQPVLVSQRVQWNQSFNEIPGIPDGQAATFHVINWYDQLSSGYYGDDIHIVNPDPAAEGVATLHFPGHADVVVGVSHQTDTYVSYPGSIGGPVTINSTVPMIVTQRVNYWNSFKEYRALTPADASRDTWFNWYDNASTCFLQNNIHLFSTGHSQGTISLGEPAVSMAFDVNGEGYFSFPLGTIGGPVHIVVATGEAVYPESRTVRCPPPPPKPTGAQVPLPVSMRMPGLSTGNCNETTARVESVGVDGSGNMGIPSDPCDVAWFNAMPRPGDNGDAVITGHVNWYGNSCAVFCNLSDQNVRVGMDIYIDRQDGSTVHFVVDAFNYYPANSPPDWLYVTAGAPQLTLITCGGELVGSHYTQRFVVHSHAV
jgi:hypothetical protein